MEMLRLTEEHIDTYIEVGKISYCQHYLHLWEKRDPHPYINSSFTTAVVSAELKDPNLIHFIVMFNSKAVGVIKIVINAELENHSSDEALLLEKIYLLSEYSGKGLGSKCLNYIVKYARSKGKDVLWLDTMKNGRALAFYLDYGFTIVGEKDLGFDETIQSEKPMYILQYKLN